MHARTVSGSLEAVRRVMVRSEPFDVVLRFWRPRAASTTCLSAPPAMILIRECMESQYGPNEKARTGQIRGKRCLGRVRTNIAQVWVNDTNTGGFGHVLPWLVSAYGRPDAIALKKGRKSTHFGWSRPAQFGTNIGRILRGRYR